MFTGIIRSIGTLAARTLGGQDGRLTIRCPEIVSQVELGSSICTSGVCLTATKITSEGFEADLSGETLGRTTLGKLPIGGKVNIEPSLRVGDEVGGHFVSGHVDAVTKILALERQGDSWDLSLELPDSITRLVAEKGSVAIDGISLTVARLEAARFSVAVVPFTYENTTLSGRRPGDEINLEADMLARYVERMLSPVPAKKKKKESSESITEALLYDHGFVD